MRGSRALLGIDQCTLADMAGLSLLTIQRMEASEGVIRGNVDSLMKVVTALASAGIELIGDDAASQGVGRGVRLSEGGPRSAVSQKPWPRPVPPKLQHTPP
jgi:transcriptional regulator with XRE-family HTH domain